MKRVTSRTVATLIFLSVGFTGSPAMASERGSEAKTLARLAARTAELTDFSSLADSRSGRRLDIRLPKDVSSPVEIGPTSSPVLMRIPEVGAKESYSIDENLSVRDGINTDVVLRRTASKAQVMTVLEDREAQVSYRYEFQGAELLPMENGRVGILGVSTSPNVSSLFAIVNTPWAVDARGRSLPTSYRIDGSYLTQEIDTSGATFPVVADPSVDFTDWLPPTWVITLNAKDQRIIVSSGGAAIGAAIGAAMCTAEAPGVGTAFCAAAGALVVSLIAEGIKEYGIKDGCDWKVRLAIMQDAERWRSGKC